MTDEKNKFDQLNDEQLKDVKGGIPYEPPLLVDLSNPLATCGTGTICSDGIGDDCTVGKVCTNGKTGPSNDPSEP